MKGGQQCTLERSLYKAKKFTFYRVKKAPKNAGIDPSRKEENGVVKCVFTPEAFVDIPVTISGSSQPLMISFAPSATVGDLKEKIQQQLNKSPDPNQILAQNNKELENHMPVRSVLIYPSCKIKFQRKVLQFIADRNSNISPMVYVMTSGTVLECLFLKYFVHTRVPKVLLELLVQICMCLSCCRKVLNLQWHEIVNVPSFSLH